MKKYVLEIAKKLGYKTRKAKVKWWEITPDGYTEAVIQTGGQIIYIRG